MTGGEASPSSRGSVRRSAGQYIVFEGGDGSGKSTQARRLVDSLRSVGREVEHVREPGSTALGESLRGLLLHGHEIDTLTEALLFSAARRDLLEKTIRPALQRGCCVVAERGFVSTLVYQGLAPERVEDRVPMDLLLQITAAVHREVMPDAVIVLDLAATALEERLARRVARDRIEGRGPEWSERVRRGFGTVLDRLDTLLSTDRVHRIDAALDIDAVHAAVAAAVRLVGALPPARGRDG